MKKEWGLLAGLVAVFLAAYFVDLSDTKVQSALLEGFRMLQWYAREHTLACVVPAMFIAGAIAAFLNKEAVLRHLGPKASKVEAYSVASVSGTVLAVCSCSVLPMFAGIYRVGAGLGPAAAFLYAGPAINVMAIFLTARVLGFELGFARVVGAILFGVVIGLLMAVIFRRDEEARTAATMQLPDPPPSRRTLRQTGLFFAAMLAFLVFSDWADPSQTVLVLSDADGTEIVVSVLRKTTREHLVQLEETLGEKEAAALQRLGLRAEDRAGTKFDIPLDKIASQRQHTPENYRWAAWIHNARWYFAGACGLAVLVMLWRWFEREEIAEWMAQTWDFSKKIIPLLFAGVLVTGFVGALIPQEQVARWVGGDSLQANFVASVIGAMWYFATLTEIPILEALTGLGMGKGPALALLLAGPALSLPSIAVIYSVVGFRKTAVFVCLVVAMSTLVGMFFGWFVF
jgi:uncharacterized membrane protein YraQ (UPF0718 family)